MSWTRKIAYTFDHTKVSGGSDLTNFTVPIVLTAAELKTVGNSGLVTNGSGFDIAPFSDAACTTMLKFWRVKYDAAAGTWVAWVKVPTMSASVDTPVYIGYANSAITTDQQDKANAFDASTAAAYVMGDGTTLDVTDHTGNFNLTNSGGVAAAGLFGGAISTNGSSTYADRTSSTPITNYPLTLEVLHKPAALTNATLVALSATATTPIGFTLQQLSSGVARSAAGNSGIGPSTAASTIDTTNWHYQAGTFNTSTDRRLLVDGAAALTSAVAEGTRATPDNISIGATTNNSTHGLFLNALTNFVIVSSVVRSDGWLTTRDAATRGYATFASAGSPSAVVGASTIVTTQPGSSTTSGVAMGTVVFKATTDGVTVDAAFVGNCVVTLTTPSGQSGSLGGTTTVACVAGVATCTNLIPTADGPGYRLTGTMSGYAAGATNQFTVVGAVVAANQALVTALGGDAKLFTVHDPRIYANGALPSFPDTIGGAGGRAAGLTLSQGTGAAQPSVSSGKLLFDGVDDTILSAADSRLQLVGSNGTPNPIHLLVIAEATVAGPVATICANEASSSTYPYAVIEAAGSNWKARGGSDGASPSPATGSNTAGSFTSDSEIAFADGNIRALTLGKMGFQTQNNVDHTWFFIPGGKQPRMHRRVTLATSGNLKLVLGRFGSSFGTCKVSWVGCFAGDLTRDVLVAFWAFARAQFGATVTASAIPSFVLPGNSLGVGITGQVGGDPVSPVWGSGTTSPGYYCVNKVSGGRGSLRSQGLDVNDAHAFVYAAAGRNIQNVIDTFDTEIALLADGTRTGPLIVAMLEGGNTVQGLGDDAATCLARCVSLKSKCDGLAAASGQRVSLVWITDPDRGLGNTVGATDPGGLSSGFYTVKASSGGAESTNGTVMEAVNDARVASPTTYGRATFDWENLAGGHYQIGILAAKSCYNATYYNINNGQNDQTHLAPAGYQEGGEAFKAFLDSNDGILYPRVAPSSGHLGGGFLSGGL